MKQSGLSGALFGALVILIWACGGDDGPATPDAAEPLFPPKPECQGADVVPLQGDHALVISFLEIGSSMDGFDLDKDGKPDNKLAGVGSLAAPAIRDSFESFDIVLPIELFDFPSVAADDCVKFAVYLGAFKVDRDGDGETVAESGGDCNDTSDAISPKVAEVPANGVDDDCDGLADEDDQGAPPADNTDEDMDGYSLADGDCDDKNMMVNPGMDEICGDGLDNNCDGVADWQVDNTGKSICTPYDPDTPDLLVLDEASFNSDGSPIIEFNSGLTRMAGEVAQLEAGPSLFSVTFPVTDGVNLELRITGTTILADVIAGSQGIEIKNGRIGGVIDANSADKVRGLEVEEIGLSAEDSLLDATYANVLGTLLSLRTVQISEELKNCKMPDIDVDQDGLEAFCDSTDDETYVVDVCVDGDGTIVRDEPGKQCTEATDENGNLRFVDGISVELNFEAVPAQITDTLTKRARR